MEQLCDHILMVRPARFGYNEDTAESNPFQQKPDSGYIGAIQELAIREFDEFVALLRSRAISVLVVNDSPEPVKTDAVFPNNWVSFHKDGKIITYPMFAPARRLERNEAILDIVGNSFRIEEHYRLEHSESEGRFLEGTGSMVLDRVHKIAYACRSNRTNPVLLEVFCQLAGYKKQFFDAQDNNNIPIYHTNVMMTVGDGFVVICLESIPAKANLSERNALLRCFRETGKEVIEISMAQMNAFAGNMLQVRNKQGKKYLVMSQQARNSLSPDQIAQLKKYTLLLSAPLNTIETYGGGSARCMMAEIFLPEKVG